MRILLAYSFLFVCISTQAQLEAAWAHLSKYHNDLLRDVTSAYDTDLILTMDSLYDRTFVLFPNRPKKTLLLLEEYMVLAGHYKEQDCNIDWTAKTDSVYARPIANPVTPTPQHIQKPESGVAQGEDRLKDGLNSRIKKLTDATTAGYNALLVETNQLHAPLDSIFQSMESVKDLLVVMDSVQLIRTKELIEEITTDRLKI